MWSNHTYLSCSKSPVILIKGDWRTETKPLKKSNPRGWIVSNHEQVTLNPSDEALAFFEKSERVTYDKHTVKFSHKEGVHLLFDEEGCFLLKEKEKIDDTSNQSI